MTAWQQIGTRLGYANLLLTLVCGGGIAVALLFGRGAGRQPGDAGDTLLFLAIWGYLVLTPLIAAASLTIGDRSARPVRVNYLLLAAWLAAVVWTLTLTL